MATMKTMSRTMSKHEAFQEAISRLWGIGSDARFWDGWRTYGDVWAHDHALEALRRDVDLTSGSATRQELVDALSDGRES
jgi:hypothetical protein